MQNNRVELQSIKADKFLRIIAEPEYSVMPPAFYLNWGEKLGIFFYGFKYFNNKRACICKKYLMFSNVLFIL